jgi:hypothetical protein
MNEYEVLLKTGERELVYGYTLKDACHRVSLPETWVSYIIHQTYAD